MREIHNDNIVRCVEYEPQCRTLHIAKSGRGLFHKEVNKYYLSFPYMQFSTILRAPIVIGGIGEILYKSFHATFSNKPLESIDHPTFYPLLPSIYPMDGAPHMNCQVCLGPANKTDDIFEMISLFWQSKFNIWNPWFSLELIKETPLRSYLVWSEKTKKDPSFITNIDWPVEVKISDFGKLDYQDYCSLGFLKK